jgi:hypothetical protein
MSNFYLLKFDDQQNVIDHKHLTNHGDLLQCLNDGFRMASMEEWDSHISSFEIPPQSNDDEDSDEQLTEDDFIAAGMKARELQKSNTQWKRKHLYLLEKLMKDATSAYEKFSEYEEGLNSLSRAQAVRTAHELHFLAGKVADAIITAKPKNKTVSKKYEPGDSIGILTLLNNLSDQCRGKAGKNMVRILWECYKTDTTINALELVARAYSHNGGSGNPFKPNTGYIAHINNSWAAAGMPVCIDISDLNAIRLKFSDS